jgi:hypothetical protein
VAGAIFVGIEFKQKVKDVVTVTVTKPKMEAATESHMDKTMTEETNPR